MIDSIKRSSVACLLISAIVACKPAGSTPTSQLLASGGTSVQPQVAGTPATVETASVEGGSITVTTDEADGTIQPLATPTVSSVTTSTISTVTTTTTVDDPAVGTPTLKIAYSTFDYFEDGYSSQMWIMDSIESVPRLLLDLDSENTLLDAQVSWSHDGERIAYAHMVGRETATISTISVESQVIRTLAFTFPLFVYEDSSTGVELRHNSWSLDDQWIHATVSVIHHETKVETKTEILMSSDGEKFLELPRTMEFVAWSTDKPGQFLYIDHPNSPRLGNESLCIGNVGSTEPMTCVYAEGFVISADHYVSWHAEKNVAVFPDIGSANHVSHIVAVDLTTGIVEQVLTSQGIIVPSLWSRDGKWLLLFTTEAFTFWEWEETGSSEVPLPIESPIVLPLTWLPARNWLIYQNGGVLAAASPEMPGHRLVLVDLSEIVTKNRGWLELGVWVP